MPPAGIAGPAEILAILTLATQRQQRVRLAYVGVMQDESEREIDPYGVVFWEGNWYLIGYCHLRLARRTFRLDRIQCATAVAASFARPSDFDALDHLKQSIANMPRAFSVRVLLDTDLESAAREAFSQWGVLELTADGVMLHAQVDDASWMARELCRLSCRFEIGSPLELKTALTDHARALLSR